MSKKQVVICGAFAIVLTIGSLANGQGNGGDLKEKRVTIQMKNKRIYDIFVRLMYVYDVPIGFEESALDKDRDDYFFPTLMPPEDRKKDFPDEPQTMSSGSTVERRLFSLDLRNVPLKDALDKIVKQMGNYDWTINDGVVNIFPIEGREPLLEKLLKLKIHSFGISRGKAYSRIQPTIVFDLPEFQAFLAENKIYSESDRYLWSYCELPLQMDLRFTDLTFKELLNGITKLKRGGWILRSGDKYKKFENRNKNVIEILI